MSSKRGDQMLNLRCEPKLDEVLHDPIVRLLMERDGVVEEELRRLMQEIGEGVLWRCARPEAAVS
jgi:hypothetical protein